MKNQNTKKLAYAALFLALCLVLPMLTGQIPQIGSMLLPMHIPVLLCGLVCGWQYGAAVGFVAPLLTLIDVAKLLQSLADAQVAVLFLVGKGGVQLVGRDIAELDQNVAEADVFHGCTPPLSQRITFRDTLNAVAVTALPSVSAKLRVSMEKDTSCTDG